MADKSKAVITGATECVIEAVKLIPGVSILIEGVRKYKDSIEEQQREEFVQLISDRLEKIEENSEWYNSEPGERFVRKIVATALNAEYTDKLEFLANALENGPSLGDDDRLRLKYIEMIRTLSKPALEVLVASLHHPINTNQILVDELATYMKWPPHLVNACVSELHSAGAYASITSWTTGSDGKVSKSQYYRDGVSAKTSFTEGFAKFIAHENAE